MGKTARILSANTRFSFTTSERAVSRHDDTMIIVPVAATHVRRVLRRSRRPILALRTPVLSLLALLVAGCDTVSAQPPVAANATVLIPGREVRCDITQGQIDTYQIVLDANRAISITVDQRGVDVVATLKDPEGDPLIRMDGPTGAVGAERLLWVVDESGLHQLEVKAGSIEEPAGCYEILYEVSDAVTEVDRQRAAAAKALAEAQEPGLSKAEASRRYEDALSRWRALGDSSWQAEALNSLGFLHREEESEQAFRYFTTATQLAAKDSAALAYARTWLGDYYLKTQPDLELALEHLLQAKEFWGERYGAYFWQAVTAADLGYVYKNLGDFHEALRYDNEAVQLWRKLGYANFEADALGNRGKIHYYLSRLDQAYDDFSKALAIEERHGYPNKVVTLTSLSYILSDRGKTDEAFRLLDQALKLRDDDRRGRATTQVALGWAHYKAGNRGEALRNLRQALAVYRERGETLNVARVQNRIGRILQESGEDEQAFQQFEEALSGFRSVDFADGQAEALLGIARSSRQMGRPEEALGEINLALEIVEELRRRPADRRLRALFFASKLDFFEFKISLLMELDLRRPHLGYDVAALAANEQARARSLIETLSESGVDLSNGADELLLDRAERLLRRIKSKLHRIAEQPDQDGALRTEVQELLRQYDLLRSEIRAKNPLYTSLTEVSPLEVDEIRRRVLDKDTLLLEYFLGHEESFLWAVTPDETRSVRIVADPRKIENIARDVYQLLPVSEMRKYRVKLEQQLAWLSEQLLAPVADMLTTKRLLIVSGGALQYVPFAALPLPGDSSSDGLAQRLISKHVIVSDPSASTLGALRFVDRRERAEGRRPAPETAAVLADPVFEPEDVRLPEEGAKTRSANDSDSPYGRLLYSRLEAQSIRSVLPNAKVAMDFDADKELATSPDLGRYRYVHFATHGTFDAQFPELSRLIFSRYDEEGRTKNGDLHLPESYQLRLSADLVVLSACQTALGEEIRGEGLVGLTQGFMYSGTPRVLASLWNVQDESTAVLMGLFYRHLIAEKRSPADALRAAQMDFLAENPAWNAPFYWAGFILQGDF